MNEDVIKNFRTVRIECCANCKHATICHYDHYLEACELHRKIDKIWPKMDTCCDSFKWREEKK